MTGMLFANQPQDSSSNVAVVSTEVAATTNEPLSTEVKQVAKEEGAGLPQFDTSKYSQQIFWLIINFGILYLFVKYFIIRKTQGIKVNRSNVILANIEKSMKIKKSIDKINQEIDSIKSKYKMEINKSKESLSKKISELSKNKQDEMDKYKQEKLEDFESKKSEYSAGMNIESDVKQLSSIIIEKLNLNK
jgi:F0F1-type ATP synthase membrane subunit b/b'